MNKTQYVIGMILIYLGFLLTTSGMTLLCLSLIIPSLSQTSCVTISVMLSLFLTIFVYLKGERIN